MGARDIFAIWNLRQSQLPSPKAARNFCKLLSWYFEDNEPLPDEVRKHLAEVFNKAFEGESLDKLFGIRMKRGQKIENDPKVINDRHVKIFRLVDQYINRGMNADAAYEEVAQFLNNQDKTGNTNWDRASIGKIYRKWRNIFLNHKE